MKIKKYIKIYASKYIYNTTIQYIEIEKHLNDIHEEIFGDTFKCPEENDCTFCNHIYNLEEKYTEGLIKRLSLEDLIRYRLYK